MISVQQSLEIFLKSNYFIQEDNREKAVDIAEYLESVLEPEDINPYILSEFLGEQANTVD